MAKKESQEIKPKKGLPRLMELAMTQKAPDCFCLRQCDPYRGWTCTGTISFGRSWNCKIAGFFLLKQITARNCLKSDLHRLK
ncbi:MAG: hypothetical protein LUI13_00140 [Lachnospiraceae bacterium]|nr:hypothetical protein [Lachnospiraceae bacterium]